MKFYVQQHKYYCGIDLHARTMYVCIIDKEGSIVKQKMSSSAGFRPRTAEYFLHTLKKYPKTRFPRDRFCFGLLCPAR
jgi:hypothetical protein